MVLKVTLIAATVVDLSTIEETVPGYSVIPEDANTITSADALAEFAGRACYQSWNRPNPGTHTNHDYLLNITRQGHESVFGHSSATFYVEGVSRSLTHELIRHRFLAFSELSQRYVDMADATYVLPPAIQGDEDMHSEVWQIVEDAKLAYNSIVADLEATGVSGKKAREAARAVLPSAMETKIVVSGNIRAWRDFLRQRLTPQADAEIRELAQEVYKSLAELAPNSMQGIGTWLTST